MTTSSWWTTWSTIFYWFVLLSLVARMLASPEHELLDANPDYELLNSSACLPARRHDDGRATMHCARGHLVKLVRLVYGHSATTGRCHYLPADCVTHLVASGNEVTCVGLNRCDVYVTSRDHGRPIPGCQLPTNYIHALFQCIPEWVVIDICNSSSGHYHQQQHQQQALRGYLSTPSYPQPYSNTADCTANLTAPHRGQRVRLYVVDLQLETAGAGCADWLHVFDGLKSVTLCGRRARRLLATSARQQLQVRFHSNQQRRLKGFWLYYEVTEAVLAVIISLFASCSIILFIIFVLMLARRRTLTTSPNQPPTSQEHHHYQEQQQQHVGSNVAQSIFSVVDFAPKTNIEKSLQRQQTPHSDRETNYSGGVVCRCSPEGDTVVKTTPLTTTSNNCPASSKNFDEPI